MAAPTCTSGDPAGSIAAMHPLRTALAPLLHMPPGLARRITGPPPTIAGRTLAPSVAMMLYLGDRITEDSHDVAARRQSMHTNSILVAPRARAVLTEQHLLAGRIPARVYRSPATATPAPVIVYLHGGGWVVGDLDTHDGSCRMLAQHSGCVVVSVDYRLAPEHPFPAGLDDAVTAVEYVHANPLEFGGIPAAVAVAGDSAGANLAAATCLLSDLPVALGLIYPATDLRLTHPSVGLFGDGFFLTAQDLHWYRGHYLPDLNLVTDPLVSPLLAPDLSGLPPTAVWTAGFDPLVDEGAAFAQRLADQAVAVRYTCFEAQIHGFFGMGVLPGGTERIKRVCIELGELVANAIGSPRQLMATTWPE